MEYDIDMLKKELKGEFSEFGKNDYDTITKEEIMIFLNKSAEHRQRMGENIAKVTEERVNGFIKKYDEDKDGKFNLNERSWYSGVAEPVPKSSPIR